MISIKVPRGIRRKTAEGCSSRRLLSSKLPEGPWAYCVSRGGWGPCFVRVVGFRVVIFILFYFFIFCWGGRGGVGVLSYYTRELRTQNNP